jgi:hypothetical protein
MLLRKGNNELLTRQGGGEAGNTGGVAFRGDGARPVLENDGNARVTVGKTAPGPVYESGERLRSWALIQLTLTEGLP